MKPILSTTYSFRNFWCGVAGLIIGAVAGFCFYIAGGAAVQLATRWNKIDAALRGYHFGIIAFVILLGCGFFYSSWLFLSPFVRDVKVKVQIDSEQIRIGRAIFPWDYIDWIGVRRWFPFCPFVQLVFGQYRNNCRIIPLNQRLTLSSVQPLMREIELALMKTHPEVEVGRVYRSSRGAFFYPAKFYEEAEHNESTDETL